MKTAIILTDNIKQIVLTPENDSERSALQLITPDDNITLAVHQGSMYDQYGVKPWHGHIDKCRGGFLRIFSDQDSIMLVLTPKEKSE